MRDHFLSWLARRGGTCGSHCPVDGGTCFGSSDGNPEPANGLCRSRSGKGVRCRERGAGIPHSIWGCPAVVSWFGVARVLRVSLGSASISLGAFSACISKPQLSHWDHDGAPSLFPPAPHLGPAAKPIGTNGRDAHGSKTLPCRFVNSPALSGVQKPSSLEIPTSAAGGLLEGLEDGGLCPHSVWDRVVAPDLSIPVPPGGRVT